MIEITEENITLDITDEVIELEIGEGGSAAVWGLISGDISAQEDLQSEFAGKANRDHTHDDRYYPSSEVDRLLAGKSNTGHVHDDRYYTSGEIDGFFTEVDDQLEDKADRDDRYYTEAEMDSLLEDKADYESLNDLAYEADAPKDGGKYNRQNGNWVPASGGSGSADWGNIGGDIADQSDLQYELGLKSDTGHNHDSRYAALNHNHDLAYSALNHTHDDRYYTESETDTLLAGKSNINHTHDNRYYTESEVDTLLAGKSDTSHNHDSQYAALNHSHADYSLVGHTHDDRYYSKAVVDILLERKSDTDHTHDDRYYTKSKVDTLLAGKSNTSHHHDSRYALLNHNHDSAYSALNHTHDDRYYTESEVDTALAGKSDTNHTHDNRYYTESETDTLLAGKSDTSHTHDERYYTETETDTLLADKADSASPSFTGTPTFDNASAWLTALGFSDSGWKTLANTNARYTGDIYYRSFGPFVFITASQIKLAADLTTSATNIDRLPEGYRPMYNVVMFSGNAAKPSMILINASTGYLTFYKGAGETWPTTENIYFTAMFFKA